MLRWRKYSGSLVASIKSKSLSYPVRLRIRMSYNGHYTLATKEGSQRFYSSFTSKRTLADALDQADWYAGKVLPNLSAHDRMEYCKQQWSRPKNMGDVSKQL